MLAHLDPRSPGAAEAVETLRLARRTVEQAGGFEAELADIEGAAHHANNYMPLVSRHWRQDRATMFAFVGTVELEATSADRRVLDARGTRHGPVIPITDALLTAIADLRYACRIIGHPLAARAHSSDLWIAASAIHIDASLVTRDEIFNGVAGLDVV